MFHFKKKPYWTIPPSDNPTLTNFFTRTEQNLISLTIPARKPLPQQNPHTPTRS